MKFVVEIVKDLGFTIYMLVGATCAFVAYNLMSDRGFSTIACLLGVAATIIVFALVHRLVTKN
ncbi:hypothetical protein [Jiella mangrovi]|uniref:CTP synthetase n=1 Tax=Jiella mangrovi TaxID=2821407 RepID=A0ABS4BIP6_9HYPH|nr:hypothetical protein [Jiella mangrovi]MBP0616635.1 hypothetical protein [Jiella mangrovi]